MSDIYNAYFSYNGLKHDVILLDFKYGWAESISQSQMRQGVGIYPIRAMQTDLNVTVIFRNPEEEMEFADFVRAYHLDQTSGKNKPNMRLVCECISKDYEVIITNVPQEHDYKTVTPTLSLSLKIVRDMLDYGYVQPSWVSGNEQGVIIGDEDNLVTKVDIISSVDKDEKFSQ